jgi:twitching motility protein PilT
VKEFLMPEVMRENLARRQGLLLVNGNRFSGVEKFFLSAIKQFESEKRSGMVFLRESVRSPFKHWSYNTMDDLVNSGMSMVKDAEVLIFENISKSFEVEMAIECAEEGRLVVMHFCNQSIVSTIHKVLSLFPDTRAQHILWRMLDLLSLSYSQYEIEGENNETVFAGEIIPLSPELKREIYAKGVDWFEERIRTIDDETGIVTFNQSLLQLLIRRKISLQKAFEFSKDPQDLDSLLKKVGI